MIVKLRYRNRKIMTNTEDIKNEVNEDVILSTSKYPL